MIVTTNFDALKEDVKKTMREAYKETVFVCNNCKEPFLGWEKLQEHTKDIAHRNFDVYEKTKYGLSFA